MIYPWDRAHKNAMFAATDLNGRAYWFTHRPKALKGAGFWQSDESKCRMYFIHDFKYDHVTPWFLSLEERPISLG